MSTATVEFPQEWFIRAFSRARTVVSLWTHKSINCFGCGGPLEGEWYWHWLRPDVPWQDWGRFVKTQPIRQGDDLFFIPCTLVQTCARCGRRHIGRRTAMGEVGELLGFIDGCVWRYDRRLLSLPD